MRRSTFLLILLAFFIPLQAFGSGLSPFDDAAFRKAQSEGRTILLEFYASWCPTCRRQQPAVDQVLKSPRFESVVGFVVDFDTSGALQEELKVRRQSTLVVLKGTKEVTRGLGLTNKDEIAALVEQGK